MTLTSSSNSKQIIHLTLILLLITSTLHLLLCPYSKVEESFNLHAIHDLYYYGISPAVCYSDTSFSLSFLRCRICPITTDQDKKLLPYEHLQYPGVVPRTFLGPMLLAYTLRLLTFFLRPIIHLQSHPLFIRTVSRFLLLSWNILAQWKLAISLDGAFPVSSLKTASPKYIKTTTMGSYYLLLTSTQFHLSYYFSRTLPNSFALILQTFAYAHWLQKSYKSAFLYLLITTLIVRCDCLLLMCTIGFSMFLKRQLTIRQAMILSLLTSIMCLIVSIPIDSLLWQRWTWPELEVLFYNIYENKSSDYGVMSWHWYGSQALPKSLLGSCFLVPLGLIRWDWLFGKRRSWWLFDDNVLQYLLPVIGYVISYSFLPHKETRFIFCVIVMCNVVAARGLTLLHYGVFQSYLSLNYKYQYQLNFELLRRRKKKYDDFDVVVKNSLSPSSEYVIHQSQRSNAIINILYASAITCLIVSFVISGLFSIISSHNYPGGRALSLLSDELTGLQDIIIQKSVYLYVDVASAMSGVSLFEQQEWWRRSCTDTHLEGGGRESDEYMILRYSYNRTRYGYSCGILKGGYEKKHNIRIDEEGEYGNVTFTHLLSERKDVDGFRVLTVVKGHPRFNMKNLRIITIDSIYVMEHEKWR